MTGGGSSAVVHDVLDQFLTTYVDKLNKGCLPVPVVQSVRDVFVI